MLGTRAESGPHSPHVVGAGFWTLTGPREKATAGSQVQPALRLHRAVPHGAQAVLTPVCTDEDFILFQ